MINLFRNYLFFTLNNNLRIFTMVIFDENFIAYYNTRIGQLKL